MKHHDQLSGIFWLAIASFVCLASLQLDVGALNSPGPGFAPLVSGLVLAFFSVILLVTSSLSGHRKRRIRDLWSGDKWGKVAAVLIFLLMYAVLLSPLGYLVATSALMVALIGLIAPSRLWVRVLVGITIGVVSYWIFYFLLAVALPKGIIGF